MAAAELSCALGFLANNVAYQDRVVYEGIPDVTGSWSINEIRRNCFMSCFFLIMMSLKVCIF